MEKIRNGIWEFWICIFWPYRISIEWLKEQFLTFISEHLDNPKTSNVQLSNLKFLHFFKDNKPNSQFLTNMCKYVFLITESSENEWVVSMIKGSTEVPFPLHFSLRSLPLCIRQIHYSFGSWFHVLYKFINI